MAHHKCRNDLYLPQSAFVCAIAEALQVIYFCREYADCICQVGSRDMTGVL